MTDITRFVPLKGIVSMFLDANGLSWDEMDRAWIIAFRALVDLSQSIAAEPKTVRLPLNGNKTVTIPSDYLSWSKIGILDSNGQISTLKVNSALTTYKDSNPNRISQLTPDIATTFPLLAGSPYFYNYGYDGVYQNLFGIGGGLVQYGECRVDETNNVIILNPEFRYDSIMLEYLSSPQNDDDYQIQIVLQEAVIAFIEWKYKLAPRELYYAAAIQGRRSLPGKKVTLQVIAQVIRESSGFYIKS